MIERIFKCDSCGLVKKFMEREQVFDFTTFHLLSPYRDRSITLEICENCWEVSAPEKRRSVWRKLKDLLTE